MTGGVRQTKMKLTENQKTVLQSVIHNVFVEIPELHTDPVALSDLAYAAHNLSRWDGLDDMEKNQIRRLFHMYHKEHGYRIFDFSAMIEALDKDAELDPKCYIKSK